MKKQIEFINHNSDIEFLARRIYSQLLSFRYDIIHNNRSKQKVARSVASDIYDLSDNHSGLISNSLIDERGYRPATKFMSKEHYFSRQEAGYEVINEFLTSADLFTFTKWLVYNIEHKYTCIHYVTADENISLSKIQNDSIMKNWTWQEQYTEAGIELVSDPGCDPSNSPHKYSSFEIKGRTFKTAAAAGKYYGVTDRTIYSWMKKREDCVGVSVQVNTTSEGSDGVVNISNHFLDTASK